MLNKAGATLLSVDQATPFTAALERPVRTWSKRVAAPARD
jgi:hypothetical protein